jgi:hypothetical protein
MIQVWLIGSDIPTLSCLDVSLSVFDEKRPYLATRFVFTNVTILLHGHWSFPRL